MSRPGLEEVIRMQIMVGGSLEPPIYHRVGTQGYWLDAPVSNPQSGRPAREPQHQHHSTAVLLDTK